MHLFTGAKITARGLGNSIHIRALIALQLQNFLFGKHIALFKSFFQIPYTGQSVISGIITVENEKSQYGRTGRIFCGFVAFSISQASNT